MDKKRVNVEMPPPLYRRLRKLAKWHDYSVNQLIRMYINIGVGVDEINKNLSEKEAQVAHEP